MKIRIKTSKSIATILLSIVAIHGCSQIHSSGLKDAYSDAFLIGVALNYDEIMKPDSPSLPIVKSHFNSITPENVMKWEFIHPEPDRYDFAAVDAFVALGEENNMVMVGHTLVWHSQTPSWVFEDASGKPVKREFLLQRLRDHIHTVVGRYKGRIHAWDVVNEAVEDDGQYRQSPWMRIIGKEYIEKAFQWAHEADPNAKLYYNDYNEWYLGRRESVIRIVRDFKTRGVPIHGIGLQGHWGLDYPPLDALEESIVGYADLGVEVAVTEMEMDMLPSPGPYTGADISVLFEARKEIDPWAGGLPDSMKVIISNRWAEFFRVLNRQRDKIVRVTVWGVQDGASWRNNWPVRGRTAYPLLFDRNYQPNPAVETLIKLTTEE